MGTRTGAKQVGNEMGLSSLLVNLTQPQRPTEARESSIEAIYRGSNQNSDSGNDEDTAGSGGHRRGARGSSGFREAVIACITRIF